MAKRNKKNVHNVADYGVSFNINPSSYNLVIFYNSQISKKSFIEILEKCLNCDNERADLFYSELTKNNHIKYGIYTKDIAETIASKMRSINTNVSCYPTKVNNVIK